MCKKLLYKYIVTYDIAALFITKSWPHLNSNAIISEIIPNGYVAGKPVPVERNLDCALRHFEYHNRKIRYL